MDYRAHKRAKAKRLHLFGKPPPKAPLRCEGLLARSETKRKIDDCEDAERHLRPPPYSWSTLIDRNVAWRHEDVNTAVGNVHSSVPFFEDGSESRKEKLDRFVQYVRAGTEEGASDNVEIKLFRATNPEEIRRLAFEVAKALALTVDDLASLLHPDEDSLRNCPDDAEILARLNKTGLSTLSSPDLVKTWGAVRETRSCESLGWLLVHLREVRAVRHPVKPAANTPLANIGYDLCTYCGVFGCLAHFEAEEGHRCRPTEPKNRPYSRKSTSDPSRRTKSCGPHCFIANPLKDSDVVEALSADERSILRSLRFADPGVDSCTVVSIFPGRTCRQLHAALKAESKLENSSPNRKPTLRSRPQSQHKPAAEAPVAAFPADGCVYDPCNHAGPCGGNSECYCNGNGTFCDRFCACPPKCPRRFPGCECVGECKSDDCACKAVRRECEPELCRCKTREAMAGYEREKVTCCGNTAVWRNKRRRTMVAVSEIAGWGLFAGEDIRRGDYVGEYKGEMVDEREVERRSAYTHADGHSYVFELDQSHVSDNDALGNRLRYINEPVHHGTGNLEAQVIYSLGSHRLAIFAKRSVKAGHELVMD